MCDSETETESQKVPNFFLPTGEILTDVTKTQWVLGPYIGKGGCGMIYSAQKVGKRTSDYPFAIKIEHHELSTLLSETHFYIKNCKQSDIDSFKAKHKLKTLGITTCLGSGSHTFEGEKYRFIVINKFGDDIDKLQKQGRGQLPTATVYRLAYQMTNALEYIHSFGSIHGDLKGENILLGDINHAYLVDFGLTRKFTAAKQFKRNAKKAHIGTLLYLSRDGHQGVPTRRGDFEILGYNIIRWFGGQLPWAGKSDENLIQQKKEEGFNDLEKLLKTSFKKNNTIPGGLLKLLEHVASLSFKAEPNYQKIRDIFKDELMKSGESLTGPLHFPSATRRRSKSVPAHESVMKRRRRAPSPAPTHPREPMSALNRPVHAAVKKAAKPSSEEPRRKRTPATKAIQRRRSQSVPAHESVMKGRRRAPSPAPTHPREPMSALNTPVHAAVKKAAKPSSEEPRRKRTPATKAIQRRRSQSVPAHESVMKGRRRAEPLYEEKEQTEVEINKKFAIKVNMSEKAEKKINNLKKRAGDGENVNNKADQILEKINNKQKKSNREGELANGLQQEVKKTDGQKGSKRKQVLETDDETMKEAENVVNNNGRANRKNRVDANDNIPNLLAQEMHTEAKKNGEAVGRSRRTVKAPESYAEIKQRKPPVKGD